MVPFSLDPRAATPASSPLDVSFLLDAPAGKHGPVVVREGHLATRDDGRRLRLWGVNLTDWSKGSQQIPSKADAPFIAATLARFGVNCVRFQFLDLPVPRGLLAAGDTTQTFDPDALDREDFFLAELEKRGIYLDLNLLVGRPFSAGDKVRDAALLHQGAKGTSLFDARLIELQKDYARQLLTHLNPYTHRRYTADPAVAIVEINNENAINVGYRPPSPFYADELKTLYNRWLDVQRTPAQVAAMRTLAGVAAGAAVPLLGPRAESTAPPLRFHTEAAFFNDLQRNYFTDFEHFLKQTLGSESLVLATADHSHSSSGYPILLATEPMDIIDGHTYWQHPEYYVHKLPMVNDPANSTVAELARSALAGKPYTVSEVNNPFPNDYAGEGIPILAAYGAFQDWDAIFWYTFEPKPDPHWKSYVGDPFDISLDPVKMPELAASALLFLRGDVAPARTVATRTYSLDQVFDSMLLPTTDRPYYTPGFPPELALEHELRIGSLHGPPTAPFSAIPVPDPAVSDTGQLQWATSPRNDGLVIVDSPRSQALIGFLHAHDGPGTSNLTARIQNRFATVQVVSLDGLPIAKSGRLLVVAGGTVQNTGQAWNSAGTDVTAWGGPPTLIDNIRGTLTLHGLDHAQAVSLQAVNGAGRPLGSAAPASESAEGWKLNLGAQVTTWYLVTIAR